MRAAATLLLFVTLVPSVADGLQTSASAPLFTFHNTFWPNLHHFLYVVARAQVGARDAQRRAVANAPNDAASAILSGAEQGAWDAALAWYRQTLSSKDAVFDQDLVAITRELARAGNAATLESYAIDPALRRVVEPAAEAYRRHWWARHRSANDTRIAELNELLAKHGRAVRDRVTRAYGHPWPAQGATVEMAGYANWSGAYSTTGGLIVVSSLDSGNAGSHGLEMIFHEAMHQWDDAAFEMVRTETRRQGKRVPNGLTHAMIFYTAGDATRREVPGHVPYAQVNGIWQSGPFAPFKAALDRAWQPWLDGKVTREEALAALVREM